MCKSVFHHQVYIDLRTPGLDSQIHKCFGRVGDGVSYEFDIGTRVKGDWGLLLDAVGLLLL